MARRIKRALSINDIYNMKFKDLNLDANWQALLGEPEASGVWIMWGNSGNGKTSFALQLAKELTKTGKVIINTLEEGARKSFQLAVIRTHLKGYGRKIMVLNREPLDELKERLRKPKAPKICMIDSFQYTGLSKNEYKELKEEFHDVLFIFISHAEGKHPEGRPAKFVRYDADVKIHIEGYVATAVSRYGGGEPYHIWPEKVRELNNN
ncbi:MAG: hypothetical protein CVU03_03445 [Bacteroidetes bacterium HGW-Bacteroidetes-2]|jgi:KaiC/GvpD/RAD55 family RecA-like ATPase|nr:MAG: hypothetical protein CVU03_03445 [Bacteroidetes bacterium HGW-Bacteroidetes-2]